MKGAVDAGYVDPMVTLKLGSIVTWGSGSIRGRIVGDDGESSTVKVALVGDHTSPCGRKWLSGTEVDMPIDEIRFLS